MERREDIILWNGNELTHGGPKGRGDNHDKMSRKILLIRILKVPPLLEGYAEFWETPCLAEEF